MKPATQKPGRTLGIILSLASGCLFFTAIPLLQVGFTLYIRGTSAADGITVGGNIDPIGGPFGSAGINDVDLAIRIIPAVLYLLVVILAWRGGLPPTRHLLVGSTIVMFGWQCLLAYLRVRSFRQAGIFASTLYEDRVQTTYLVMAGITVLYTTWYLNRAPARAFFRGYFADPAE